MFSKILIANRGEIACRIMRTCADMGVATVAVYSAADRNALHTAMADEAIFIGPAPATDSYLDHQKIIDAALETGAQAIHPGYGFLSENAEFAKKVAKAGLTFIGPPVKAISLMGGKSEAKALMEKAGVPLVPGYHGDKQDATFLKGIARKIGYPVLIKASAGGGGKGMRVVNDADEFKDALDGAKREAKASFGNDHVLIEKYLTKPRHVEMQVFGDNHGNYVHLFERDCSLQRRHQKVVEEAPAPGMTDKLRAEMGQAAIDAAKAVKYSGAGTVEFLLDEDERFYFMEMNTRLQVEHPVTEEITGVDLVEWQLRVAAGEELPLRQDDLQIHGHAIEVRLYAEDPDNNFLPAAGKINYLTYPQDDEAVRIETAVFESPEGNGDTVSIHYDPMIAKIITHGETRDEALNAMTEALAETRITGLKTNLNFLQNIIMHPGFQAADLTTGFLAAHADDLFGSSVNFEDMAWHLAAIAAMKSHFAARIYRNKRISPWDDTTGWRQNGIEPLKIELSQGDDSRMLGVLFHQNDSFTVLTDDDQPFYYELNAGPDSYSYEIAGDAVCEASLVLDGQKINVLYDGMNIAFQWHDPLSTDHTQDGAQGRLTAPMPGKIVAVKVSAGDSVKKGMPLVILEAMKMEHTITAPADGEIAAVNANPGDQVDEKLELVSFK